MTFNDYTGWSTGELIITLTVCIFATYWTLRKKSARERLVLIVAGIVLVAVNFIVIATLPEGDTWRDRLPVFDILWSAATFICLIFNRMIQGRSSLGKKDKNPHEQQ